MTWLISRFDREHVRLARYQVEELICTIMQWPIRGVCDLPPGLRRDAESQRWREWTRSDRLGWYARRVQVARDHARAWSNLLRSAASVDELDEIGARKFAQRVWPQVSMGELLTIVRRLRPIEPLLRVATDQRNPGWVQWDAVRYLAGLVPARVVPRIEKMLARHYRPAVGLLAGIDDPRAYRLLVKSVFGQITRLLGIRKEAERRLAAIPYYLRKGENFVVNPRVPERERIQDELAGLELSLRSHARLHGELLEVMRRAGNHRWSDYMQRLVRFHGWNYINYSDALKFFEVKNFLPGAYPVLKQLVLDADAWIAARIRRMLEVGNGGGFAIRSLGIHSPAAQIPALLEIWEKRLAIHRKCHLGRKGCRLASSLTWKESECYRAEEWNQLLQALAEAHPRSPILARRFMNVDGFSKYRAIQWAIPHMERKDVVDFLFRIATDPSSAASTREESLYALRRGPGNRLLDASQERTLREMAFGDHGETNTEVQLIWAEWARARRSQETPREVRRKKSGMDLLVELLLRGDPWHRYMANGYLDNHARTKFRYQVMRWRRWWRDNRREWGSGMSAYRRHVEAQRHKKASGR